MEKNLDYPGSVWFGSVRVLADQSKQVRVRFGFLAVVWFSSVRLLM